MSLRIRRGTDAERQSQVSHTSPFEQGELIYTTDSNQKKLYIGDGVTHGGVNVVKNCAGVGLAWNDSTQTMEISSMNLSTANVGEDATHLYYTDNRARLSTYNALSAGTHTGISFSWDAVNYKIDSTVALSLLSDNDPYLGGNLTLNGFDITGTGNIDYNGSFYNQVITINDNMIETTTNGLKITSTNAVCLSVASISPGNTTTDMPHIAVQSSKGNFTTPAILTANDTVGGLLFKGYNSSAAYITTGGVYSKLASNVDMGTQCPASIVNIITGTNSTTFNTFSFDNNGVFTAPVIKATSYASNATYPSNPAAGWIIFDTATSKFMGFNGISWDALN